MLLYPVWNIVLLSRALYILLIQVHCLIPLQLLACAPYSTHGIAQPGLQSTATVINRLKLADPLETDVGICTFAPLSLPAGYDICEFHSVNFPQKYDSNKTVLYNKALFPCFVVSIPISAIAISCCMCHNSNMPSCSMILIIGLIELQCIIILQSCLFILICTWASLLYSFWLWSI